MTKYHKNVARKYQYKDYTTHFKLLYQFSKLVKLVCLLASIAFSTFFFKSLADNMFPEYSIFIGFIASVIVAVFLSITTDKMIVFHEKHKGKNSVIDVTAVDPFVLIMFLGCVIGGISADFFGSPELSAHYIGSAPTDTTSAGTASLYKDQVKDIDKQVYDLQTLNYYWCKPHQKAHRCNQAGFYVDPVKDRKVTAKIEALQDQKAETQSTMTTFLSESSTRLNNDIATHTATLEKGKNRMQYASIIATSVFLLLSVWGHKYGRETVKVVNKNKKAKGKTKKAPKKAKKAVKQPNIDAMLEKKFAEMASQSDALLEEKIAMLEAESAKKL